MAMGTQPRVAWTREVVPSQPPGTWRPHEPDVTTTQLISVTPTIRRDPAMLLPGMWVEVLPLSEILETLDENQSLEGIPFMPEMLPYCGRRFRVAVRAERTCVHPPEVPFRRLGGTVVLEGLRCDGSLHGGCQLGCMMLWKEAWLRRIPASQATQEPAAPAVDAAQAAELRATRVDNPELYFCQATALPAATTPGEPLWMPGQYLRALKVRTYSLSEFVMMFARPVMRRIARVARLVVPRNAPDGVTPEPSLGLQPGELAEVRSADEIRQTLDESRMLKGLTFAGGMYEHCGQQLRVLQRVDRLIEEKTGRLRPVTDTVILEGSTCSRYFGCARQMPYLWRESWLKRPEGAGTTVEPASRTGGQPT